MTEFKLKEIYKEIFNFTELQDKITEFEMKLTQLIEQDIPLQHTSVYLTYINYKLELKQYLDDQYKIKIQRLKELYEFKPDNELLRIQLAEDIRKFNRLWLENNLNEHQMVGWYNKNG